MARLPGVGAKVLACLLAFGTARVAAAPYAERIDPANHAQRALGGPDAVGGVGDWALGDGILCAVVNDPAHETSLRDSGGTLLDLGHCGRADDRFLIFEQLANLSIRTILPISRVEAVTDEAGARLLASGGSGGLAIETTYALDVARPGVLRLETRVERRETGEPFFGLGFAFGTVRSLRPFTLSSDPAASRGFEQVAFFGRGLRAAAAAAHVADWIVLVGDDRSGPGVSYGIQLVEARREHASNVSRAVPHFVLADDLACIAAVLVRPFYLGDDRTIAAWKLIQTRFMDLEVGDALSARFELHLGARADAASITNRIFADAPVIAGRVDDATARLHLDRADGSALTEAMPDPDGRFEIHAPVGEYRLRVVAPGWRELALDVRVDASGARLGTLAVGRPARVRLPRGRPMRLVFVGEAGTPDPRFGDDLLDFTLRGAERERQTVGVNYVPLSGSARDPSLVTVAPGRYRVLATRGPEFSVTETRFTAVAGETVSLSVEPPVREVDTPGWIASDFHVHGPRSPDTPIPLEPRVASYVAEGGEVLVSTDHDVVADYAPTIREMDLEHVVTSLIGVEVTGEVWTEVAPWSIGHANSFPLPLDPLAYRSGAVDNEGRRWRDVFADLRALPGRRVVQLNHPRFDNDERHPRAFFSHLRVGQPYDPTLPLDAAPNASLLEPDPETGLRDLDFDAVELLNGPHYGAYALTRRDWFSLLRQGVRWTGVANSDSHFLCSIVAATRNYVPVALDRPDALDVDAFVAAILGGRSFGTTGPFVEASLGDASPGDTFAGRSGTLRISVRAASWVPVSALRVQVDGEPALTRAVAAGDTLEIPLVFERDGFVTLEVEGEASETYATLLPRYHPLAFTNPIYVDADGDGRWTAPGLP